MSKQITLSEIKTEEPLDEKLESIVDEAREKYGYYKMHISGMYEMISSAAESELYDILELRKVKNGEIGFYFDRQLFIKFIPKKDTVRTTKELYSKLLNTQPCEKLKGSSAPRGGVCVVITPDEEIEFFKGAIEYLIKAKKPAHKFGCCSQYDKCSKEKRCLHENQFYSKGCFYRENIENGKIFYGENSNC